MGKKMRFAVALLLVLIFANSVAFAVVAEISPSHLLEKK